MRVRVLAVGLAIGAVLATAACEPNIVGSPDRPAAGGRWVGWGSMNGIVVQSQVTLHEDAAHNLIGGGGFVGVPSSDFNLYGSLRGDTVELVFATAAGPFARFVGTLDSDRYAIEGIYSSPLTGTSAYLFDRTSWQQ